MRFLVFALPLVYAYIDNDFTIEEIVKNVDHSVKPCDDFYRHVCSSGLKPHQLSDNKKEQWFKDAVSSHYPTGVDNVVRSFRMRESPVRTYEEDVQADLYERCLANSTAFHSLYYLILLDDVEQEQEYEGADCWNSSHLLSEKLESSNHTLPREYAYDSMWEMRNFTTLAAWYGYIKDEKNNFAAKQKVAREMFVKVKETMLNLLLKSPWVKKHDLSDRMRNIMDKMTFYSYKPNPKIEEAFVEVEQFYYECIEKRITGYFLVEHELCMIETSVELSSRMESAYDDQEGYIANEAASANAHWGPIESDDPDASEVVMYPPFYGALEFEDEMSRLVAFGLTLGHEVAHGIFTLFDGKIAPSDYDCVVQEMNQTCKLFAKNLSCHSGYDTLQEDAADLAARRTILIMAKELAMKKNTYNSGANRVNLPPAKVFYYGIGAQWCDGMGENSPEDIHSSSVVRVNGVLRQSEDFHRAFQCKEGDDMVMEKDDLCHLLGENATR